jgi:Flp pilus assembly pilin Flp
MRAVMNRFKEIIRDEEGGEIIEYVLIAGLIIVAAISVVGAFGTKVVAKWTSVNSSL